MYHNISLIINCAKYKFIMSIKYILLTLCTNGARIILSTGESRKTNWLRSGIELDIWGCHSGVLDRKKITIHAFYVCICLVLLSFFFFKHHFLKLHFIIILNKTHGFADINVISIMEQLRYAVAGAVVKVAYHRCCG